MNKEKLGALMDGIYAIAATILVLELPKLEAEEEHITFAFNLLNAIVDYSLSFTLLFAFWYHQRKINDLVKAHSRLTLCINGMALMLACLIPYSTSLLYSIGEKSNSTNDLDYTLFVDTLFIGICLWVNFLIHLSLWAIRRTGCHEPQSRQQVERAIYSRRITTAVMISTIVVIIVLPGPNRNVLFVIPILLMFEKEIVKIWERLRPRRAG